MSYSHRKSHRKTRVRKRQQHFLAVKFVGLAENPADIAEFDPEKFVEALFD